MILGVDIEKEMKATLLRLNIKKKNWNKDIMKMFDKKLDELNKRLNYLCKKDEELITKLSDINIEQDELENTIRSLRVVKNDIRGVMLDIDYCIEKVDFWDDYIKVMM